MADEKAAQFTEEQKAKIAALREALIEGEKSGMSRPFDFEVFLKAMTRKHRAASRKKLKP